MSDETPWDAVLLQERFIGNVPVIGLEIERFRIEASFELPADYLDFLRRSDGGEGMVGEAFVILWRLAELLELNKAYQVDEYAPGLFLFGSDGGGDAYAFDLRRAARPVVEVPFVGMDLSLVTPLAPNFTLFLDALASLGT